MSHARSTFPYDDDCEVVAHFLLGLRRKRDSAASPLSVRDNTLRWDVGTEVARVGGVNVAWFNPTDNALMGKLLSGAGYHPGVLLIHAITDMLGAPEMRVLRESEPLEIRTGARRDAPVIGFSPSRERHRFFFAGTPVHIDQPFLIVGPTVITAYRAANKLASKKSLR